MKKKLILICASIIIIFGIINIILSLGDTDDAFPERVKIALREVGNQLLLKHEDSTSLILPVIASENSTYTLSFQESLSFEPSTVVSVVENAFINSKLPSNYIIEVLQCSDKEVAYSYIMNVKEDHTIIPCAGRYLPEQCYAIVAKFINQPHATFNKKNLLINLLAITIAIFLLYYFYFRKQQTKEPNNAIEKAYNTIGSFKFFPEQNKLIKAAVEIELSKKECELLAIFASRPNEIIKRDELTKKVWEDHGVFVGRSLDTYISKLRKKLIGDDRVKLTNVHGVGYKLEIHR